MAKRFSHQMAKNIYICKWTFFAISTFAIIEEIAFALESCNLLKKHQIHFTLFPYISLQFKDFVIHLT